MFATFATVFFYLYRPGRVDLVFFSGIVLIAANAAGQTDQNSRTFFFHRINSR
jgi:hypothetical protein